MKPFLMAWFCVGVLLLVVAFAGLELAATLVIIVGTITLIGRLQGKGNWAVSHVIRDRYAALLRLLSHLLLPQGIVDRRKSILALMGVAGLTAILLPPWSLETNTYAYHAQKFEGYAFMLAPPKGAYYQSIHIDYGRLGLEFVSIFLTGGILFLLPGHPGTRGLAGEKPIKNEADELLQDVVKGFRGVADKRAESLSDNDLRRICAFFLHQQQTYGPEFVRQHLTYELKNYEREGLRDDYRA